MTTIYKPTKCSPSVDFNNSGCVDLSSSTVFSAMVNGLKIDSYELLIKKQSDNSILYDSGNSSEIQNTNSGITYGGNGVWTSSTNSIIDDNNTNISYYGYGWQQYTNTSVGYYGNTVHNSPTASDYILYNFTGTGINCYFTKGKDKGIFQVYVDDVDKGTVDTYISNGTGANGNNMRQLCYSISNLSLGSHTIKIVVLGTKNSSSSASNIEFDYFQILNANGAKNSNTKGNYLSYTFTNTGVNVFMDKTPDAGIIDILIDGISTGTIDLYSSIYMVNTLVYSNLSLSSGQHTIQITVTGNKNSESTNSYAYFDKLQLLDRTILGTPLYDKQFLNITLPPNTVTFRGKLKWQLIYWNSDNNGEYVASREYVFVNMSIPVVKNPVSNSIDNKQYTFNGSYIQSEKINIKKWKMDLYSLHYILEEGFFGVGEVNGETIDEGNFEDTNVIIRYHINEGEF